ncbi:hypothetical protein GF373_08690, partial [bacterium]|nr:hypothetical protein [bacterium]
MARIISIVGIFVCLFVVSPISSDATVNIPVPGGSFNVPVNTPWGSLGQSTIQTPFGSGTVNTPWGSLGQSTITGPFGQPFTVNTPFGSLGQSSINTPFGFGGSVNTPFGSLGQSSIGPFTVQTPFG